MKRTSKLHERAINSKKRSQFHLFFRTMVLKLCVATPRCIVLLFQGSRTNLCKLSAVLFVELTTAKFSAALCHYRRTVVKVFHNFNFLCVRQMKATAIS